MNLLSKLSLFCLFILSGLFLTVPATGQEHEEDVSQYSLPDQLRADSLYYDAMKAKMQGDLKRLQESMEAFTRQRPRNANGWYELARVYLSDKQADKAATAIKKAISLDDDNKWYKSFYASVLEANREYKDAADLLMKLAKQDSYGSESLFRAVDLYKRAKKYKDALEAVDMLIALDGDEDEFYIEKMRLYLVQNDLENAVKIVEGRIAANPLNGRMYAELIALYESNDQPEKATAVYKRAEQMVPDDPAVQHALIGRSLKNKDTAAYTENVKKLVLNKSLDTEVQLRLLDGYLNDNLQDSVKRREVLALAKQLSEQHPKDPQVAYTYAMHLQLNGENEEALRQLKKSIEIDQSNLVVWEALLRFFSDKENADSLNFYADKSLRLFPNNAGMHFFKALAQINKEDYKSAITTLNRVVDMIPDENKAALSRAYATMGDTYNLMKQHKLSDEAYRKALEADPNNYMVLNNFSYFLSVRGENLEEAERMSRQTVEKFPEEPIYLDTYGWILYKQGKYAKAKDYILKALELRPQQTDGTLYDHIGDVYFKLNDKEKALEYWKKAKELGTENPLLDKKIQEQALYE